MLPLIMWAVLILILYPISYARISALDTPVNLVNMANRLGEPGGNELSLWAEESQKISGFPESLLCFHQTYK